MSFSDLSDSDKQRLGAAFFNIKDQKSAMSKDNVRFPSNLSARCLALRITNPSS
jgi:hypothetical protein